jgi:beta-glucosidase
MTFPRSVGQCPIYYNHYKTGRPKPDDAQLESKYISAYIDERNTPLYPFGYGLSYTKFEISDLKVSKNQICKGESITASVKVANVGERAGEEVVQLYIYDKFASVVRPVKELKGFKKIKLEAGESKVVSFEINESTLSFYNAQGKFVAELGEFDLMIGNSSDNLLSTVIEYK